jgi:hypothetical protein
MMLLKQQERAKHVKECAALEKEVRNPTPMTQLQRLWELGEYLPRYFRLRNLRDDKMMYHHLHTQKKKKKKL